eukprot:GHVS01078794.1.p1 GENE.GHVS01078794.1~~GHVS01078794.1.p1  ORF type:complete len:206 (+),score=44.58 GHVS01078794.1:128-745(+)
MWTFVGMPTGKGILLFAAVAAVCVSVANGEARTVADSEHLKNNVYGTTITASVDWTPAMLEKFFTEMKDVNTSDMFGLVAPVVASEKKDAICRMVLKQRAEERVCSTEEIDNVVDQTKFFNSSWVDAAKAVTGTEGSVDWKITEVDTKQNAEKAGVTGANINDGMSEEFYKDFPADANSAFGLSVNKLVTVAVGCAAVVASMAMW